MSLAARLALNLLGHARGEAGPGGQGGLLLAGTTDQFLFLAGNDGFFLLAGS